MKVPLTPDGLKTCKALSSEGTKVNVTLCFSAAQALLAAKAGATFISPFVGRLDDIGTDGMELIADIVPDLPRLRQRSRPRCWSPRCAIRSTSSKAAKMGAHVATLPPSVLQQMFKHPLTDKGLAAFLADWRRPASRSSRAAARSWPNAPTALPEKSPSRRRAPRRSPTICAGIPTSSIAHPELLRHLTPPARQTRRRRGRPAAFHGRAAARRRSRKLRANQDELIANSRDNLSTQERIHKAVLALLGRDDASSN